ncbi:pimeloyl-ACP methyl ester esterase BioH [Aliiglaciecola sp. LCG003]|uniref:pimeloyl-ACP methyl ester esterase BioH n=1 Tax=Aliiglaciecola sp. LCG003 TaxID=3053655 RepID=UPI0025725876|nr:pimeloyl-ACP methyl ester esterase BioH [Aliiglaciecola sp. LCG003]WJG09328.1 pimeloyl-ACP methyl ester esterase BioH [Aliiglaciecola sp. LCG003]
MTATLYSESRGQGPNLVLLHGWGLNSGVWEPISHLLERHFRVTFIDLPGFGRNANILPQQYDLPSITSMVASCLPDKCSLLGWSLGGLVAQQIAIQQSERIDKLVLLACSAKFSQDADWPGIKPEVLAAFERQLEQDFSKTLDRFMAIQAMGSETARADIKQIQAHIQHFPIPDDMALQAGLKLLNETDLRQQIGQINCPTYRLYGRLDSLVPVRVVPLIAALQANCTSHIFAHASHAPFISHPEEFFQQIKEIFQISD